MARIPGKMRRRQWVRDGDLIIVWPWDFQDAKADVKHRYNKTQALYLSRKGVLPDAVDVFGLNIEADDFDDEDGLFSNVQDSAAQVEEKEEAPEEESEAPEEEEESEAPKEEISEDEEDEDDDDDEIDNLFA
jgi:hypothetical protein